MGKNAKQPNFNIHKGHTLTEYFDRFHKYYNKGKIFDFRKDEMWLMDEHHTYWEIVGPDKVTRYYQLPNKFRRARHLNPNRQKNRAPIIASSLVAATGLLAVIICFTIGITVFKRTPYVPPAPTPEPVYTELMKRYHECFINGKDPFNEFRVDELANIAAYKLKGEDKKNNEDYHYLCVGRGWTKTDVIGGLVVTVNIRNVNIRHQDKALEESISLPDNIMAPTMGRREYEDLLTNHVTTYNGSPEAIEKVKWETGPARAPRTIEEYVQEVGKKPHNPFSYTINENTVVNHPVTIQRDGKPVAVDTKKSLSSDQSQMIIEINLDGKDSVLNYIKRMNYISGHVPQLPFNYLHTVFTISHDPNNEENDSKIQSLIVDEQYDMGSAIPLITTGHLETRFYTKNLPEIPKVPTNFDYSKFPF